MLFSNAILNFFFQIKLSLAELRIKMAYFWGKPFNTYTIIRCPEENFSANNFCSSFRLLKLNYYYIIFIKSIILYSTFIPYRYGFY